MVALALARGLALGDISAASAVSSGWYDENWAYEPYVDLDRTDQGAVASGMSGGVVSGIRIGTTGWACPIASAVVGAAAFYIAANGLCLDRLRNYPNYLFSYPMRCVS